MNKTLHIIMKTLKASLWVAIVFVLIFVIIAALIQIPFVQNKIVNYATTYVSNKTKTRVEIKNISIAFPKTVVLQGLYIEDLENDTLLYAGKAKVNIVMLDILQNKITVNNFSLERLSANIYNSPTDSLFNYNFLITAFSSKEKMPSATTESESEWVFSIDKVSLKNIRIRYDDAFAGMSAGASLEKLTLEMNDLNIAESQYGIDKLLIEGLFANVLIQKKSTSDDSVTETKLPHITAQNIQIKNSFVTYADLPNKQSVSAAVKHFKLVGGDVDLHNESVIIKRLDLSESKIKYFTSESAVVVDSTKQVVATSDNNWKVTVNNIDFSNNSLLYQQGNLAIKKNAFDANHINFSQLNLKAKQLLYSNESTALSVTKFSAIDHNGFEIKRFETDFAMNKQSIQLQNAKINTKTSYLDADVSLGFASMEALMEAHPNTSIKANIPKMGFSNADILYFMPELRKQDFFKNKGNITSLSGNINGTIGNLKAKNIVLKTGTKTSVKGDFHIVGLPNAETAFYHFPNLRIISSQHDIKQMAGAMIPENIEIPENISIEAEFKGKIKRFATKLGLTSSMGNALFEANVDKNEKFSAIIEINDFDLGRLLKDKEMYGPLSLKVEANGKGLEQKTINANIKAHVSKLFLNKYSYQNLSMEGIVANQQFDGKINLDDENIVFDFAGLLNFNPGNERLKFAFKMKGADLQKLNLSEKDMRIAFDASADLQGGTLNNLNGKAGITQLIIINEGRRYKLDSLLVATINQSNKSELKFSSALINMKYSGTISPTALPTTLSNFIDNYFAFNNEKPSNNKFDNSNFKFEIELHNHPILSNVLFPQLNHFEPGIIAGSFDSQKKALQLNANMKRIVYAGNEMNNIQLKINSDSTALNYNFSFADIGNEQLKFDNFMFEGQMANNKITANISMSDLLNKKLSVRSVLSKENENFKFHIDPKDFYLMNNPWKIDEDNAILFTKNGMLIQQFFMQHASSKINISSLNGKTNDDLAIIVENFELDDISRMIEKNSNLVRGSLDANILLKRINNTYGIVAEAFVNKLIVQNTPIGNLALKTSNPTVDRFDIDLTLSGTENLVTAKGFFVPNGGENSLKIQTDIQQLSMKTIEAFSMGQITQAEGILKGEILIAGSTESPEMSGEIVFKNVFMNPAYLNNRIGLKDESIQIQPDAILFKTFTITDASQQKAIIDGSIKMKQFSNFVFDLHLNSKNFLLFNTSARDNDMFFGRMIVDSKIDITGPISLPVVNAHVKMKDGSNFTFVLPEGEFSTSRGENVVVFVEPKDENSILNKKTETPTTHSSMSGFDLFSIIEVDKNASLRMLMDPNSADSLVVRGEAALSFAMDRSGKMSLTGAYNLNEGSYLVSLESIIKRKFDIVKGSTIIWNGDPLDANVSIDATYTVRTAPYNLVADQMLGLTAAEQGAYRQMYPFLVVLKLRGAIMNPEISFEIQLLPEDKGALGGALQQKVVMLNNDPSTLNKQVFALLVMGRFVQENPLQSESLGAAAIVRSSVSNFLSAQLNQLSAQFVPGVELNFDVQSYDDFQTGEAQGRTQVELGLKKELFNERLTVQVGGVIDVEGDKAKQNSASEIASDVNIEYKITKDGRYRLKGFRNNQYEGIIDGQLVETGVGVVYVREFNKWSEFFRKPKAPKRKTEQKNAQPTIDTKNKVQNVSEE